MLKWMYFKMKQSAWVGLYNNHVTHTKHVIVADLLNTPTTIKALFTHQIKCGITVTTELQPGPLPVARHT
jgi:hypothetical protein